MLNENANPVTRERVTLQVLGVWLHASALICQEFEVEVIPIKKKKINARVGDKATPTRNRGSEPSSVWISSKINTAVEQRFEDNSLTVSLCLRPVCACAFLPPISRFKTSTSWKQSYRYLHLMLCSTESKWCIFWYQINTIWIIWDMHPLHYWQSQITHTFQL